MTDCPNAEVRDQLPLFVAGRLDAAARAAVAGHVADCADCRAELALLERVRGVTAASPAVDTARVVAAVRAVRPRRRPAWPRWSVPAAAAAAALLAVLVWDGRPGTPMEDPATMVVGAARAETDSATALSAMADAGGLTFGGGLADLTESELEALATSIADIDPLLAEEPRPIAPEIPFEPEESI